MGRRSAADELRSSHACFTRALAPKLHITDLHQYPEQLEVLWLSQWWERRLVGRAQRPRTDNGHRSTQSGPYLRACVGFGLGPNALMGYLVVSYGPRVACLGQIWTVLDAPAHGRVQRVL